MLLKIKVNHECMLYSAGVAGTAVCSGAFFVTLGDSVAPAGISEFNNDPDWAAAIEEATCEDGISITVGTKGSLT